VFTARTATSRAHRFRWVRVAADSGPWSAIVHYWSRSGRGGCVGQSFCCRPRPAGREIQSSCVPILESQSEICRQFGAVPDTPDTDEKLGIALDTLELVPLNGLRHPREDGTCGWYIWGGTDFPRDNDAFSPMHVSHLPEYCPSVIRFLALPPGWRFLTDGNHVDVWQDQKLLDI